MVKYLRPTHLWIKTNMAPLRGWVSRRKGLIAHVPHGHWKTLTFLAALRHDWIDVPWVLNSAITATLSRLMSEANFSKP
jgi:hypothetical protein